MRFQSAVILCALALSHNVSPTPAVEQDRLTVAVIATTPEGRPVTDLQAPDFTVTIDGRPADVEDARFVGDSVAIVFMLDRSASMAGKTFSTPTGVVRRRDPVAEEFDDEVVPVLRARDRVRFGEAAGAVSVGPVVPNTKAAFRAATSVQRRPDRAGSPIWDGVVAAVSALRDEPDHRLVVLVTDGEVSTSRRGLEDAATMAVAAQTTVSVVAEHGLPLVIPQEGGMANFEVDPGRALRWLADATAGGYWPDATARGELFRLRQTMAKLVARAITESHGAYRLTLRLPREVTLRSLQVSLARQGVIVRAPAVIGTDVRAAR